MAVHYIPKDQHAVIPYLVVPGVDALIEFLKKTFDAELLHRSVMDNGRVMHAQVRISDSTIMMGEPTPDMNPFPASIYLYVPDCDAAYRRAIDAGAKSLMEPTDQFHGDRYGGVQDASGNRWWIVTHIEDVSPEEMARREKEFLAQRNQQERQQ